jgi:hypothetical protein
MGGLIRTILGTAANTLIASHTFQTFAQTVQSLSAEEPPTPSVDEVLDAIEEMAR